MQKTILFLIVFALLSAACGGPAAAQVTQPPATQPVVMETQALDPTAASQTAATEAQADMPPTATEAPADEQPAAAGGVVFKIVPVESQLIYEVGETFLNDNNRFNLAVGTTPQVEGEIIIDRSAPQNSSVGTITADISQFTSDSSRRDNAIRDRFIQTSRYPTVTFVPTQIEGLPETYVDGQDVSLKITGDLTIREVTKPVTFDAVIRLEGDQLTGQAVTTILMSDFEFGPISIGGMLNTEDQAKVTLNLVARP